MKTGLTLPPRFNLRTLDNVDKRDLDLSGKKWLEALILALEGGHTAEQIARKVRRSYKWLFNRRTVLFQEGLLASLTRKHSGGRRSLFGPKVESELLEQFRPGDKPADGRRWLREVEGISATKRQVYKLWQKLGLAAKQPRRPRRVRRPDALYLNVDELTMEMIAFVLGRNCRTRCFYADVGAPAIKLGILWILSWRASMLDKVTRGEMSQVEARTLIPSGREIARNLQCSFKLVYTVAGRWKGAGSRWDIFLRSAFPGSRQQKDIQAGCDAFLREVPRPKGSGGINIEISDSRCVRFQAGEFTPASDREKWLEPQHLQDGLTASPKLPITGGPPEPLER